MGKADYIGTGLKVIASGLEDRKKRREEFQMKVEAALAEKEIERLYPSQESISKSKLNEVQSALYQRIADRMGGGQPNVQTQIPQQVGILGQQPQQTGIPPWDITGASIGPGGISATIGESPEYKSYRESEQKLRQELATRRQQTQEGFRRAMGLFTNLTAQFKSKIKAQGGEGGVLPGVGGLISGKLKGPGSAPIEAYEGQRKETALSLNNIITGQNRVIKGVVEMLESTLPSRWDTSEFAAQKIAQSVKNSFRLLVANNRGLLTQDILNGFDNRGTVERFVQGIPLTPEEEQQMNTLVSEILNTPEAQINEFNGSQRDDTFQDGSLESQIRSQLPFDLEDGSSYEVETEEAPTSPILKRGDLLRQRMRENVARTEEQISRRPSQIMHAAELYGRNPASVYQHPVGTVLNALGTGWEVAESSVANPLLGVMRGAGPGEILENVSSSLIGQRPAQLGDVFRYQGFPSPVAATAGLATAAPTLIPSLTRAGLKLGQKGIETGKRGFGRLMGRTNFPEDTRLLQATSQEMASMTPAARERAFQLQQEQAKQTIESRIQSLRQPSQPLISYKVKAQTLKERIAGQVEKAKQERSIFKTQVEAKSAFAEEEVRRKGEILVKSLERDKEKLESALTQRKYGIARVIQDRFSSTMKKMSEHYRSLYDEGIRLSKDVRITSDEARSAIQDFAHRNPEVMRDSPTFVEDVMERIGFIKGGMTKLTDAQGRPFVVPAGTISEYSGRGIKMPSAELTVENILKEVREARASIPTPAKAGTKMYTHADMMADDIAEALREIIRSKASPEAVKQLDAAGTHWAKWKPISREAFGKFDPFTRQPIGLKGGMTALEDAASSKDPNAVQFIDEIERYMEIPKGTLSSDIKQILSKITDTEKRLKLAKKISESPEIKKIQLSKSRELESIDQKFSSRESMLNKRLTTVSRAVGQKAEQLKQSTTRHIQELEKQKQFELDKVKLKYQNAKHIDFQKKRALRRAMYSAGILGVYQGVRFISKKLTEPIFGSGGE